MDGDSPLFILIDFEIKFLLNPWSF